MRIGMKEWRTRAVFVTISLLVGSSGAVRRFCFGLFCFVLVGF